MKSAFELPLMSRDACLCELKRKRSSITGEKSEERLISIELI